MRWSVFHPRPVALNLTTKNLRLQIRRPSTNAFQESFQAPQARMFNETRTVLVVQCLGFRGLGFRLGRPLGYLTFSLMALIRDPIYQHVSKAWGFAIGLCGALPHLRDGLVW